MSDNTSTDTAPLEVADKPTPKAKPKAAAPKPRKALKDSVVGNGDTDPVVYSRVAVETRGRSRKSLTVHHLQRRLAWLGYAEAASDLDGQYGTLTIRAVQAWQADNGAEATGDLTREQFLAVFEGDPNVTPSFA
jgi:peptidoglycan hydrolase-like protein with peptidoglycan-binding domain